MNVLVACEFSGIVREAFKAKGHYAVSCDLLDTEIPGNHCKGDVLELLAKGWPKWDLIIAHPPCTYLCNGGQANITKFPEKRWKEHQPEAIEFFMSLINLPIHKIAVENPIGIMSTKYRKPDQIIRPFQFGHPYKKDVALWLKNLPKLEPTNIVEGRKKLDFWSNKRNINGYSQKSKTFQGIAEAMADQWGSL